MIISIIAAMATNRVIGHAGNIPWSIPGELRRFREITTGHTVIMGRRTYEVIGRPLPRRTNIVLTRRKGYSAPGCLIAKDLKSALKMCSKDESEVFICGGSQLYKQALPVADRIYLSVIQKEIHGDTYFPVFSTSEFRLIKSEYVDDVVPYIFSIYERVGCKKMHDF